MNKKHGFTLIELLAVIVVLAIIALIATPIVMNTIKRSKKGAAERSADSYVKQVEVAIASERLNGNILEGEYQITNDGNLCRDRSANCSDDKKIKIEMNGDKPTSGKITITNGTVEQGSSNMTIGDYTITYNSTKKTYEATEKESAPQVEVLCTAVKTATAGNIPSGKYVYGDEYTCELGDNDAKTFFVLETNGDKVSLIMDKNIDSNGKGTTSGNTVAWISKKDYLAAGGEDLSNDKGACEYGLLCATNEYGPITALKYLKDSTTSWTKLTESQISLPTGQQIATAGGDSAWTNSKSTGTKLSEWLLKNISGSPTLYGYWTSTPNASYSSNAWFVSAEGTGTLIYNSEIFVVGVDNGDNIGVRPVITLAKSQLN